MLQQSTPLEEDSQATKTAGACILVIFGATGDLTARRLIPALYNLFLAGQLPSNFACVGFARRDKDDEIFRQEMHEAVNNFSRTKPINEQVWKEFREKIFYHKSEFHEDEGYEKLNTKLQELDKKLGTKGNRVYYLSTQPSFFPLVVEKLSQHNLLYNPDVVKDKWSRVIIEKPFGQDLKSAIELQNDLVKHLHESQIFRIDHYLGKETVQNLLVFRFGNPIFESIWNNNHIDNVQLTVSEDLGIGTRGHFFEEAGMLRDIVQNHMMQLLSLVAMEPPVSLKAQSIHDEKVKVLSSIRPLPLKNLESTVVRGQYGPGFINRAAVRGYREEDNVDPKSSVETYVALKLFIDNWRWSGVPFYLRAGKRLPKRITEIAITFKHAPGFLFQKDTSRIDPNVLVIRIQPDEGISLKMNCKVPGQGTIIQPVMMDFRYGSYFGMTPPEAYERLICDCMAGDRTLFARDDEVMASWKLLSPILDVWNATPAKRLPQLPCRKLGPTCSRVATRILRKRMEVNLMIESFDERRDIVIPGDHKETIRFCIEHFLAIGNQAIADRGSYAVALSGGSTPKAIFEGLCNPQHHTKIDWSKVLLFWSDERAVEPSHPDSNYLMAMEAGFKKLPIPKEHIFRMEAEHDIEANAARYEKLIEAKVPSRSFDLVMLGMGDDGHTASLFPQTHALQAEGKLVVANYIPQKKTWRMTLTFSLYQCRKKYLHLCARQRQGGHGQQNPGRAIRPYHAPRPAGRHPPPQGTMGPRPRCRLQPPPLKAEI